MATKRIACIGDTSDHGGTITDANQSSVKVAGLAVAVDGALFNCPTHGEDKVITAITSKSKIGGKLIVTADATASCGAKITPANRGVYVE